MNLNIPWRARWWFDCFPPVNGDVATLGKVSLRDRELDFLEVIGIALELEHGSTIISDL